MLSCVRPVVIIIKINRPLQRSMCCIDQFKWQLNADYQGEKIMGKAGLNRPNLYTDKNQASVFSLWIQDWSLGFVNQRYI